MEENEEKVCVRGWGEGGAAVTAKPDVGRVYCFAIKSNTEKKRNMQSEGEL